MLLFVILTILSAVIAIPLPQGSGRIYGRGTNDDETRPVASLT